MNIKEQPFTCKRDSLTIRGMQFLPAEFEENGKYPVVIASHGFTDNYLAMADYCRDFAEIGYAAFCFSFCGGGRLKEDEDVKSEGKTIDMTIASEVEDLIAVKNHVKTLPFADINHLILMGFSQGGFVSGLTAARCGEEIEKLIMISPALCIPDHARKGCLGGASYSPDNVPDTLDCGITVLGRSFHEEASCMDAYLEIIPYQGPVLLLHGLEDQVVPYSYAVRAKESYREGQCQLHLIKDQGHAYNREQQKNVFALICRFLKNK